MAASDILRVLTHYADAWTANDLERIVAAYHDDIVLHYPGQHALSGQHRGKAAALGALAEFGKRTSRQLIRIVDVMAGQARGAIIAHEALGPANARVEVERLLVYRIESGLLRECWIYDQDQALINRLVGP
ncbi:MAG TPA: nuclear transport factor 2 family protein [Alphaproteobacteria bacterium]|nr:nuclear transport factor 2 family protein [Alphaproteobacteria bacterium]HAJ46285.1 nuclear transport factor 2 family protein [Alphaproteobacteria bacterium]